MSVSSGLSILICFNMNAFLLTVSVSAKSIYICRKHTVYVKLCVVVGIWSSVPVSSVLLAMQTSRLESSMSDSEGVHVPLWPFQHLMTSPTKSLFSKYAQRDRHVEQFWSSKQSHGQVQPLSDSALLSVTQSWRSQLSSFISLSGQPIFISFHEMLS